MRPLVLASFALWSASAISFGCSSLVQNASPFEEQNVRCELRPGTPQCTDWRKFKGPSTATMEGVCRTLAGAKKDATGWSATSICASTESLGGCQATSSDGTVQTNWYFKSEKYPTAESAKSQCSSDQTWTDPK